MSRELRVAGFAYPLVGITDVQPLQEPAFLLAVDRAGPGGQLARLQPHRIVHLGAGLGREGRELGGTGELSNTGIEFKVPLQTQANPATGQLTTISSELVQAPYNEVRIRLNGGPRAAGAQNPGVKPLTRQPDGRVLRWSVVVPTSLKRAEDALKALPEFKYNS